METIKGSMRARGFREKKGGLSGAQRTFFRVVEEFCMVKSW